MKIGAISLGCDKNRVDTEKMLSRLVASGHTLVGSEAEADIIIVNTCAFIEDAKNESIDEILLAVKAKGKHKKVIATGCLSERYIGKLEKEFPEVDAFLGIADYDGIVSVVEKICTGDKIFAAGGCDEFYSGRVLTTPFHYAYLKIADGCNNRCTYCAIPAIRGEYRSESMENLLIEAQKLSDDGVKELILVAQDVTRYGIDFDGKLHLIELVKELEKLEFEWIRLLYLEPEMVTDELIDFIANSHKIVKYMDIPFQHVDDKILKLMNRHSTEISTIELVEKVKAKGIAIRSSFICGFPNESEESFQKLKSFIKSAELDFAGFFAYSREEDTPADKMSGHLHHDIKKSRASELQALQSAIIASHNKAMIGKTVKVIYEGIDFDRQMFQARAEFQAPEIDTNIYFTANEEMQIGCFYNIEIVATDGIEIIGRTKS